MGAQISARVAGVVGIAMLGLAPTARAAQTTLDYNAGPKGDFRTAPYLEKGITTTVNSGHYELYANSTGADGDEAFNLDEQNPASTAQNPQPPIFSKVTLWAYPASYFDVVSLDVINPTDTASEYTISALDGQGNVVGSIPAPTVAGTIAFPAQFQQHNIAALVVTQHSPGSFTFDNVTVNVLPEPSRAASLCAAALALVALRRRRSR